MLLAGIAAAAALLHPVVSEAAEIWTQPYPLSATGDDGCSVPAVACGASGKVHVMYRRKTPDWRLRYRQRGADGVWGPVETVSVPWSERPAIIEDAQGRAHAFYAQSTGGGKTDLYEAIRSPSGWTVTALTNTAEIDEDYPRLAQDASGRIHLAYTSNRNICYRVWNGSWSGPTVIGTCETTYYHRPDLAVTPGGIVHVTWEDRNHLYYRRLGPGDWSPTATLGTTAQFFSYGKIAAPDENHAVVVTFDQSENLGSVLRWTSTADGGRTWTTMATLGPGHYPNTAPAKDGRVHLVYQLQPGGSSTLYRAWGPGGWTVSTPVTSDPEWEGWADVDVDAAGHVHVVYDNQSSFISCVQSTNPPSPPSPPVSVSVSAADQGVILTWRNPAAPDVTGTVIRASMSGYAESPTDGLLAGDVPGDPGAMCRLFHTQLTNGQTYYYSLFAYDSGRLYSNPAHTEAVPRPVGCMEARLQPEGTYMSLKDKVVSGVFPEDGCFYVQDQARGSGLRVVGASGSVKVGDRISVSGTMGKRILSGVTSEMQLVLESLGATSTGPAPIPMAFTGIALGGGPLPSGIPGAKGSSGTNTIGLLLRSWGVVTLTLGSYLYIDDGCRIPDVSGRVGVMVRYPEASVPVSIGQYVEVTGVLVGSIPSGWTSNRRLIQMRSAADLRILR